MSAELDTRALEVLAQVIEARRAYMGETAAKSVTATCINLLTSLRADTATVGRRPTVFDGRYLVEIEDTGLVGGWAKPPKHGKRGHRVVRPVGGGKSIETFNGYRVINLAGDYARAKTSRVFRLSIFNRDGNGRSFYPAKAEAVFVMAIDEGDVRKFAERRIARRIGQYRGISKRAIGAAMRAFGKGGNVGGDLQRLADAVTNVRQSTDGISSGVSSVAVEDNLPHAQQALKSGGMNQAFMKAVNRTVGIINAYGDRAGMMWERLAVPFPEVANGAGRSGSAGRAAVPAIPSRDTLVRLEV